MQWVRLPLDADTPNNLNQTANRFIVYFGSLSGNVNCSRTSDSLQESADQTNHSMHWLWCEISIQYFHSIIRCKHKQRFLWNPSASCQWERSRALWGWGCTQMTTRSISCFADPGKFSGKYESASCLDYKLIEPQIRICPACFFRRVQFLKISSKLILASVEFVCLFQWELMFVSFFSEFRIAEGQKPIDSCFTPTRSVYTQSAPFTPNRHCSYCFNSVRMECNTMRLRW